jgi:hypothetical protein
MTKHGFTVWCEMIRLDLFKISNAEVRKGALKLLGTVECAGFCLDKVPEARESLILPNLTPLIDFLSNNTKKKEKSAKAAEPEPVAAEAEKVVNVQPDKAANIQPEKVVTVPPMKVEAPKKVVATPVFAPPMEWRFTTSPAVEEVTGELGFNAS